MKTKQVTVSDLIEARKERDTYREMCVELVEILKDSHLIREGEYRQSVKDAITKAEKLLGSDK